MGKNDVPVLLITFKRPETTKRVFEKIREYQPGKLFIFSDGPRPAVPGEDNQVQECRSIFNEGNIDWECSVTRWYSEENMGCAAGVNSAITRAFNDVEKLIILEDDIVPHSSFFEFCNVMLRKYEHSDRVMQVSGTRYNEEFDMGQEDHFFSTIGHIWGWATWKRAWARYDFDIRDLPLFKSKRILTARFNDPKISKFWHDRFDEVYYAEHKMTWDYQWQFSLFKHDGLAVVPMVNLTSNIGIVGDHSDGKVSKYHFCNVYPWTETTKRLLPLDVNLDYELHHIRTRFLEKPPMIDRINGRLKKILQSFNG